MSKTMPVRWWRDDATRYHSRPPYKSPPYDGPMFDMPNPLPRVQWANFDDMFAIAVPVIPRDSLKLREPPPDPWEDFTRRQLERINRGTAGS